MALTAFGECASYHRIARHEQRCGIEGEQIGHIEHAEPCIWHFALSSGQRRRGASTDTSSISSPPSTNMGLAPYRWDRRIAEDRRPCSCIHGHALIPRRRKTKVSASAFPGCLPSLQRNRQIAGEWKTKLPLPKCHINTINAGARERDAQLGPFLKPIRITSDMLLNHIACSSKAVTRNSFSAAMRSTKSSLSLLVTMCSVCDEEGMNTGENWAGCPGFRASGSNLQ